ncbi:hypothetical protein NSS69_00020 [Macrococcus sp. FSL W8-0367]
MKLITSQINWKINVISIIATIVSYLLRDYFCDDDIKNALTSIITLISVNFAIYGVTLSIIASIHERTVIKKLLREGSKSKIELKDNDSKVFNATLFALIFFILFQMFFTLIMSNLVFKFIFIFFATNSMISTVYFTQKYFKQISSALFEYTKFEE